MQRAQTFKSHVLIDADRASQIFWEHFMKSGVEKVHHKSLFRAMLGDPILRPLLEIRENGATSIEGAFLLKSIGFLNQSTITIPSGPLAGQSLAYISLARQAINCTYRWRARIGDDSDDKCSFNFFRKCIRSYLVVDRGAGIAITKAVAEVALDLADEKILGRLAAFEYDNLQFDLDLNSAAVSESDWLARQSLWSKASNLPRTGAGIIDLFHAW